MMVKLKSAEVWFKAFLFFVFAGFFVLAKPYPADSRQFPQLMAVISMALTLIALTTDFMRAKALEGEIGDVDDTELKVLDTATKRARRKRFYLAWAIILAATAVGILGGFLLSTVCLFFGFGLAFGNKKHWIKITTVSVGLTVLVYIVFGRIMAVPLLDGLLW